MGYSGATVNFLVCVLRTAQYWRLTNGRQITFNRDEDWRLKKLQLNSTQLNSNCSYFQTDGERDGRQRSCPGIRILTQVYLVSTSGFWTYDTLLLFHATDRNTSIVSCMKKKQQVQSNCATILYECPNDTMIAAACLQHLIWERWEPVAFGRSRNVTNVYHRW